MFFFELKLQRSDILVANSVFLDLKLQRSDLLVYLTNFLEKKGRKFCNLLLIFRALTALQALLTLLKPMQIHIIRVNQLHFFAHLFLNRAEMLQLIIRHQSYCSSRFMSTTRSSNSVNVIER